jgi:hypothetical protein
VELLQNNYSVAAALLDPLLACGAASGFGLLGEAALAFGRLVVFAGRLA